MSSCEFAKNEYKLIQEANKCSNETNKCFTCVKEFTIMNMITLSFQKDINVV